MSFNWLLLNVLSHQEQHVFNFSLANLKCTLIKNFFKQNGQSIITYVSMFYEGGSVILFGDKHVTKALLVRQQQRRLLMTQINNKH